MHIGGRRFRVASGDVVGNQPFGEHGLANASQEDLHVVVFKTSPGAGIVDAWLFYFVRLFAGDRTALVHGRGARPGARRAPWAEAALGMS
jgi:hypothetical protein